MLTERPLVSVIIPTFNSERFLEECLLSLKNQTYRRIEVILVDDGSTDRTVEVAKRSGCRIVNNPKRGRAEAKNEGVKVSGGEYVFFVDSDMELTTNVIAECVKLAKSDLGIGGIVVPERSIGDSFWVRVRDFERTFYAGSNVESARFFRSEIVERVGGFEEGLTFFEESTLPYKIEQNGYNVVARVSSVIRHHEENFLLGAWLRKKFFYGETIQAYKREYGSYFAKQMGIVSRCGLFLRNWRVFWGKPTLAVGVILLKSQEWLAVTLGSICSRLE